MVSELDLKHLSKVDLEEKLDNVTTQVLKYKITNGIVKDEGSVAQFRGDLPMPTHAAMIVSDVEGFRKSHVAYFGAAKDTRDGSFVADTENNLDIGIKQPGAFRHSSFLRGSRISAAGLITVKDGQLRIL
ncbi:hypothetical protein HO133_004293 [Letharia lupina]|uniref:Uncharacterized protein n=1 Tax=Letharia lupina TaxID=560253 RepID=A0A8H6FK35_9LECA|nr:uncharacterized protein HO133_004293 [Letharia lupina]KAF6229955.1 hypothetical protein HO133_004293 [Letharia lupina]